MANNVINKKRALLTFAIILIVLALFSFLYVKKTSFQTPAFTTQDVYGNVINQQTLSQSPTIIEFWATSCTTCLKEMPNLIKLQQTYGPKGLKTLSIAMQYDKPNSVLEFTKTNQLPMSVIYDHDGSLANLFAKAFGLSQIYGTPTLFLIAPDGSLQKHYIGKVPFDEVEEQIKSWASKG